MSCSWFVPAAHHAHPGLGPQQTARLAFLLTSFLPPSNALAVQVLILPLAVLLPCWLHAPPGLPGQTLYVVFMMLPMAVFLVAMLRRAATVQRRAFFEPLAWFGTERP